MYIIAELTLLNELEVCVWKYEYKERYDVEVVDPNDVWDDKYDKQYLDAESVIRYISSLNYAKKKE